jgi:hypothetical protein
VTRRGLRPPSPPLRPPAAPPVVSRQRRRLRPIPRYWSHRDTGHLVRTTVLPSASGFRHNLRWVAAEFALYL